MALTLSVAMALNHNRELNWHGQSLDGEWELQTSVPSKADDVNAAEVANDSDIGTVNVIASGADHVSATAADNVSTIAADDVSAIGD